MVTIGRNPARIIPVWRAFVDEHAESVRGTRGIGEPIWAARTKDELVECERHEALLNLAFSAPPNALQLMCPYDVGSLPWTVIEEARRNHPVVTQEGVSRSSSTYVDLDSIGQPFDAPLPDPVEAPVEMRFDEEHLSELRAFVMAQASAGGSRRPVFRTWYWRSMKQPPTASDMGVGAEPSVSGRKTRR